MKNIMAFIIMGTLLISLSGCQSEKKKHETIALDGIDTIYIHHGSTNVHLTNSEEANVVVYYGDQHLDLKQEKGEMTLHMKRKWYQIGPRINLNKKIEVVIPKDFSGEIILEGGSGNITSDEWQTTDLEVKTKSGNVTLEYAHFQSNLKLKTISGNVNISFNNDTPDINLKVSTVSGNQVIAIPLDKTDAQNEKKMEGTAGGETHSVQIKTTSGNISLK